MRIFSSGVLGILLVAGSVFAQDSDFAGGPQYLTSSVPDARSGAASNFFVRPISTPSMSLSGPPMEVGASNATGDLTAGADTRTVIIPQAVALPSTDLFPIFYGVPSASVLEINLSGATPESNASVEIPNSILDTGVTQIADAKDLQDRGYGIALPEAAAYGRSHVRHATRIFTNTDIERLRGGL
jgi:hypothetical protein